MARSGAKRRRAGRDRAPKRQAPRWAAQLMAAQKTIVVGAVAVSLLMWITLESQLAAFISAAIMISVGLVLWRADRLVKRAR